MLVSSPVIVTEQVHDVVNILQHKGAFEGRYLLEHLELESNPWYYIASIGNPMSGSPIAG